MLRSRFERLRAADEERGAVLLVTVSALLGIIVTAAIVVDLASARNDRTTNQTSTDSAAAAGAMALAEFDGKEGCRAALEYLEVHLETQLSGASCAGFPTSCSSTTPSTAILASNGTLSAWIVHPVDDDDPFMDSAMLGAPDTTALATDRTRCDRIGVGISEDRNVFFGSGVVNAGSSTTVHTVATANGGRRDRKPINLLVLNRTDCETISIGGGGSNGGIIVRSVTDAAGVTFPGLLASDSNGTTNCGSDGVLDVNGSGAVIRSDGEPGCAGELASGPGHGCGSLEVFVDAGPGCSYPACTSSGVVAPAPTMPDKRLTRAQIDWAFNCKAIYPAALDIKGCPDTSNPAYIDDLRMDIGTFGPPAGFRDYKHEGYDCNVGPGETEVLPVGNWWVDCNLTVKGTLIFEGGNIVLDGDLRISSSGMFEANYANTETLSWWPTQIFDHREHSSGGAFIYMRNGKIDKTAQGSLRLNHMMVYMASSSSYVEFGGGSGGLDWIAPIEGPFDRLALWTEGTHSHQFSGGSSLNLEGVFFVPYATVSLQGDGSAHQIAAQFVADKLSAGGNGRIEIAPLYHRMVLFDPPIYSEIIR